MRSDTLRWGISSTGTIAATFVQDLRLLDDASVIAVGSRTPERAGEFAARFGIPTAHPSNQHLADDPDVDVVYVASPHSAHHDDVIRFLDAGKHVLCEKPFALNAAQATAMFDSAVRNGRFLMEGVWSRFVPGYVRLGELLAEGSIGTPEIVEATFGTAFRFDPAHRLFDPALGGGALLDLGIYPLQLAQLVLGPATHQSAQAVIGATGVDETIVITATHGGDGSTGISRLAASMRVGLPGRAAISGPGGFIEFGPRMHAPQSLTVHNHDGTEVIDTPFDGTGLRFEAREVMRCVRAGLHESPGMPRAETLALARTMDALRAAVGVVYDCDDPRPR